MNERDVKIHGIYHHFKEKYYIVEDVAYHSETRRQKRSMLFTVASMTTILYGFVKKKCSLVK